MRDTALGWYIAHAPSIRASLSLTLGIPVDVTYSGSPEAQEAIHREGIVVFDRQSVTDGHRPESDP